MGKQGLRIGMVAGEASGDMLGADLMVAIKQLHPNALFEGIGGEKMKAEGFSSFFPMDRLSVMGLVEPLKRLPELLRIRRYLREHFLENPPDVFIGIDSPDFNLGLEIPLKKAGITTVHYVSPSVWAWRQGRIKKIARAADLTLTLFPFEAEFYRQHNVPVAFVGHSLADRIPLEPDQKAARERLGLPSRGEIVALLPGSRGGEVELMGRLFIDAAVECLKRRPDLRFLIPAANAERRKQIEEALRRASEARGSVLPIHVYDKHGQDVMLAADVVLVASGTTTLEAMLLKRPMVVAYKMAPLSFKIISRLVKIRYVALPNLLADQPLVPELLQDVATSEALAAEVLRYFEQPNVAKAQKDVFLRIHQQLRKGASEQAANAVLDLIDQRRSG